MAAPGWKAGALNLSRSPAFTSLCGCSSWSCGNTLIGITAFVPSSGLETNRLADTLGLLAKRVQLRLHEFGLNSHDVIKIFSLTQFLYEIVCNSDVFLRTAFEFFT